MPSFHLVKGMFASGALEAKNGLHCPGSTAPEFGSNTSLADGNQEFPKIVLGGGATYVDKKAKPNKDQVIERVRPMDVDPLGAGSLVEAARKKYSDSNINYKNTAIVAKAITSSTTLEPGDYYLTDLTSNPGSPTKLTIGGTGAVNIYVADNLSLGEIKINAGSGPLTIFYDGTGPVGLNGAELNKGGTAGNLKIIAGYKPAQPDDPDDPPVLFDFDNKADISGLVYAPFANIVFKNQADVKGLLWGKRIEAKNKLTFEYDATVEEFFNAAPLPMLMTWKQL